MTAPFAAPPYALQSNEFPCPGIASLAARAPVGGQREAALACMTLARLARAAGPPVELSVELRRERADAARAWLSTLPLDAATRAVITRAMNMTVSSSAADIADQLEEVAATFTTVLDSPARDDLTRVAQRLRR